MKKTSIDCFELEVLTMDGLQNKICIVSIIISAGQVKENKILYITMTVRRNGSSYSWLLITENMKRDKAITRIKHKNCSIQWEFKLFNMSLCRFCSEGTGETVWLLVCLQQRFVWIYECSSYRESAVFIKSQNCLLKFK